MVCPSVHGPGAPTGMPAPDRAGPLEPGGRPTLSVVIPTRGPASRLRATLACLAGAACAAPPFEVVLVDDTDDNSEGGRHPGAGPALVTVLACAARWLPLRRVPGPRRGRAAARNTGAAAALGSWLVFLDSDVLVGPGFLATHAQAAAADVFVHGRMRELPTAERFLVLVDSAGEAAVQRARTELVSGPDGPRSGTRDPRRRLVTNALERAIEQMADGTLPDVAPWLGCVGANVAMAHTTWATVGGFDEGFGRVWGCEDLELGLRLYQAGFTRRLCPDALGIHLSHARPGRWEQHAENLDRFAELHPRPDVTALRALLGPTGTPGEYVRCVQAGGLPLPAGIPR